MKACLFPFLLLFVPVGAGAAERLSGNGAVMQAAPAVTPYKPSRAPASVAAGDDLFTQAKPGDHFLVQNSLEGWNDQEVTLVAKFEDSVRVRNKEGQKMKVEKVKMNRLLSPEVESGESHGVEIRKGDTVFYPSRSVSFELPEAKVVRIFRNNSVLVENGVQFLLDLKQLGKRTECSPVKENICVGKFVEADGYRLNEAFNFEGTVEQVYTNGVVIIRSGLSRFPIDARAVKERLSALDESDHNPAVITSQDSRGKEARPEGVRVVPQIEAVEPTEPRTEIEAR